MAIVVVQDLPGLTQETYDAVVGEADLARHPATGLILHAGGPHGNNWRVLEVWEMQEAFDAFVHDRLFPAIGRVLGENTTRPRIDMMPVHTLVHQGVSAILDRRA